jgi:hypothetical protein
MEKGVEQSGLRVLCKIPRREGKGGEEKGAGEGEEKGAKEQEDNGVDERVFGKDSVVERVLGEEVRRGVVRIVEWMEAEPTAVLESGAVVCAVHHGGANSFLESVRWVPGTNCRSCSIKRGPC